MDIAAVWWILAGLAVFAISGYRTFEKPLPLGQIVTNIYFEVTFIPVLFVSIVVIGMAWWQIPLWIVYLLATGLLLDKLKV